MRAITKGSEPDSLRSYRATSGATWGEFRDTQELRASLVAEQRGLCCYCMCRISANASVMKIEHWQSRSGYKSQQLIYANLLAACLGGQGSADKHCDTRKGSRDLKFNPADPLSAIESRIRYGLDGTISSPDAEFSGQLDDVLGLNIAELINSRKGILTGLAYWLRHEKAKRQGPVPKAAIKRMRDKLLSKTRDDLEPFVQVKIWWLEQRLLPSYAAESSRPTSGNKHPPKSPALRGSAMHASRPSAAGRTLSVLA